MIELTEPFMLWLHGKMAFDLIIGVLYAHLCILSLLKAFILVGCMKETHSEHDEPNAFSLYCPNIHVHVHALAL